MTAPTMANLAKHIGRSKQAVYYMKRENPKQFNLLWIGWLEICKGLEENPERLKEISK